ncbi:MAG: ferredoxin [Candidatus Hecatellales archaeon]|nr:MAG: ferredoxin [Candidatus Hecatellales archaeon]
MESETFTVLFEPDGRRVKTSYGFSVLQAAKKAGVSLRSECGGRGVCGKCKVIIKDIGAVNKITEIEKKYISGEEANLGYRLACQTKIYGNLTVVIPQESRLKIRRIQVEGLEKPIRLNPTVKKFHLKLLKPSLSDIKPDLERVFEALPKQNLKGNRFRIDYDVLKGLPEILRRRDWDITVTVWGSNKIIDVESGDTLDRLFGFAVDVGTSKIVGHLVDLNTGETVNVKALENPQVEYGEDILSRLTFAISDKGNLETLQRLVVDAVNRLIAEACEDAKISPSHIYELVVVGNTAMHHLFLAVQPKYVTLSPFTPAVKDEINFRAKELNLNMNRGGIVTFLPLIAGFIGSDALADLLVTGLYKLKKLSLLMDIGTNTEIMLGNFKEILACSCASGPTMEGCHHKDGLKAVGGAIERLGIESNYEVWYKTIGDVKPVGLCGSAIIDVVAEMFKCGIIDNRGRFNPNIKTRRLRGNSVKEFVIVWGSETATGMDITVTQKDIDEVLLAKAAIFTGCSILMKRENVRVKDIEKVFVAGNFGNYINLENAKILGLIPDIPNEKVTFVGNAAISGAKMALVSRRVRRVAEALSKKVRYLELTVDPDFNKEFIDAMFIPHKDLDRFPSVKQLLQS